MRWKRRLRAAEREAVRRQQLLLSEAFAPECTKGHGRSCLTAQCAVCTCRCGGYNHGRFRPPPVSTEVAP